MKKIALIAMTAATAISTPAMAAVGDVEGTVNIKGEVSKKCYVVTGTSAGSTFDGVIPVDLGELSKDDGTLKDTGDLESAFNGATTANINARVVCTSANPAVSVQAFPLATTTPASSGYTNTVNYNAKVGFSLVSGTDYVEDASGDGNATTGTLSGRLKATGDNVAVRTNGWTASGVLVAGTYNGRIEVEIKPGV